MAVIPGRRWGSVLFLFLTTTILQCDHENQIVNIYIYYIQLYNVVYIVLILSSIPLSLSDSPACHLMPSDDHFVFVVEGIVIGSLTSLVGGFNPSEKY